jgi:hypothetical protein
MTALAQVVHEHGIAASQSQVVAEFSSLLGPQIPRVDAAPTVGEERFLPEHGGVAASSKNQLHELESRSSARALTEAGDA